MTTEHFACNMCGGCCSKSPSMNVFDMIELSDTFIFQLTHKSVVSQTKNPLPKELAEHYQILGHTLVLPEMDSSLFYWVDFSAIVPPSYETCPMLVDKKCSIYSKRPMACQIAPLKYEYPEVEQEKVIKFYKDKTIDGVWDCSFSTSAPVIYQDGLIVNNHLNNIYYNSLQQIRDFTDKYIESMNNYDGRQESHLKSIVKAHMGNNTIVSDLIHPLFVLINHGFIKSEKAYEIIENQLNLIQKDIKRATDLKIKKDVKYSRLYKKIISAYEKALSNKIFDVEIMSEY